MAGLRTEHCVEIRVPAKTGGPCFGSGYALAPHWVLTAHHVLFPQDRNPDSKAFQIVWRDTQGCPMPGQPVARDDIVWYNKRHDIALIRCEPLHYSDVVSPWDLIDQRRPAAASSATASATSPACRTRRSSQDARPRAARSVATHRKRSPPISTPSMSSSRRTRTGAASAVRPCSPPTGWSGLSAM